MSDFSDKFVADPQSLPPAQSRPKDKRPPKSALSARGTAEAPPERGPARRSRAWQTLTSAVDRGLKLAPVALKAELPKQQSIGTGRSGSVVYSRGDDAIRRKKIIQDISGANLWILAIGMMEGPSLDSDYPLGDTFPARASLAEPKLQTPAVATSPLLLGKLKLDRPLTYPDMVSQRKTGGSANYGAFKMNWYMIRQTETGKELERSTRAAFTQVSPNDLADKAGMIINDSLALATRIIVEAWEKWGHAEPDKKNPATSKFWAGHRWGETGLLEEAYGHFLDVYRYYQGVSRIKSACEKDPEVWINNMRYWSEVPAI